MVYPGDVLKLNIVIKEIRSSMGIIETQVLMNGKLACDAELVFIIAEREEKTQHGESLPFMIYFDNQIIRIVE